MAGTSGGDLDLPSKSAESAKWTRVGMREEIYCDVMDFINEEGRLLDQDRYKEWLELVTDDIEYEMPQRNILYKRDDKGGTELTGFFFDNKGILGLRVRRQVGVRHALDRDPAPRVRRFIAGVCVWKSEENPHEYKVRSNVNVCWHRLERDGDFSLTAERIDLLRQTPEGLRLARRLVDLDNCVFEPRYSNIVI